MGHVPEREGLPQNASQAGGAGKFLYIADTVPALAVCSLQHTLATAWLPGLSVYSFVAGSSALPLPASVAAAQEYRLHPSPLRSTLSAHERAQGLRHRYLRMCPCPPISATCIYISDKQRGRCHCGSWPRVTYSTTISPPFSGEKQAHQGHQTAQGTLRKV